MGAARRPSEHDSGCADAVQRLGSALRCLAGTEPTVRAWECMDVDAARAAAQTKRNESESKERSVLRGVIVGVKDVIDVAGFPTKAGSQALASAPPAEVDATVVARLRRAGCNILGKVKTAEFACLDPSDTANPVNVRHTPGGSSSGSAAAVAAGSADLTLGTQTAGSVCRPAAYCGVAAFKPTTGSMPATGVIPFARTFDTVGFFAREMKLAFAAFQASRSENEIAAESFADIRWDGLRFGILADEFYADCDPSVSDALDRVRKQLEDRGARGERIVAGCDFPKLRQRHRIVMYREAAMAHPGLLAQPMPLGPRWRAALGEGITISDAEYWKARDGLVDEKNRLAAVIAGIDFLLLPPVPAPAPLGLESTGDARFIVPWTVFGAPLAVLPVANSPEGLPTAVMIAGHPWTDDRTGKIAIAIEEAIKFARVA